MSNDNQKKNQQIASNAPVVARLMLPDDANIAGNVHGGTILKLMEQAGMIFATRHFNNIDENAEHYGKQYAGLARIETMSFLQPMFVGEIASLSAKLVYTSNKSLLVKVTVTAENAATGKVRVTNTGLLWYLSFIKSDNKNGMTTVAIPQIPAPNNDDDPKAFKEYNQAKAMYEARSNNNNGTTNDESLEEQVEKFRQQFVADSNAKSPTESAQTLSQMVLPGDCGISKIAFGGFVMKLMDTAAGCCAYRHTRTNVVTVSISPMDFTDIVKLGDIVTIHAAMTFTSAKSMEITVTAYVTSMTRQDVQVAKGSFNFVSLDQNNKVIPVPPLKYETKEQFEAAYICQVRYEKAKKERQLAAAAKLKKHQEEEAKAAVSN